MVPHMRIVCLMIFIVTLGCSSVDEKVIPQETTRQLQMNLVFEKELKGEFFGVPLNKPIGVALDYSGNIFIVDAGNNRVLKFDSKLNPLKQIGGFGASEGNFNFPTYISFDNGLNLMVSDEKNRRIARFNSQLQYVDEILFSDEEEPLKFGFPSGISFTNFGEVWIADRDNNQIAIFNNIGKYSHSLGEFGYSGGQLSSPEKIIRDFNGDFLVCDAGNKRVVRYDEYASFQTEFKHDYFEYPTAITIKDEKYFILDSYLGSIFCLDKNGYLIGEIDSKLLGDKANMFNPSDLIFISEDQLLITDTGNDRVVVGKLIIDE